MPQHKTQSKPGIIVFATDDSAEGAADARQWLRDKKLKPDQVRLFKLNGQVLVEALQSVFINCRGETTPTTPGHGNTR